LEKKVVGIEFLSSYRNDTTYGGERARRRTSQGAKEPGGESSRGRNGKGAKKPQTPSSPTVVCLWSLSQQRGWDSQATEFQGLAEIQRMVGAVGFMLNLPLCILPSSRPIFATHATSHGMTLLGLLQRNLSTLWMECTG